MKSVVFYLFVVTLIVIAGCSSQSHSVTSKAYHNLTAHYNGYYYALEEIAKVEATINKSNIDDYNKLLRLYPTFDSALAKGYEKEIQEAIKMASLAIQRHPNSKWVDDAYIQVGKARMYSLDWGNAIQTFKYVNKIGRDENTRHKAIITLIRTFTEHKEFNNAQAAIDYLQKAKLSKTNHKNFALEKAYFYQVQNNLDYMVRNLAEADPLLKKKDRKGRIYFIIGQVYQKLGFESEAYNYYKKCLATNPEYEVDFYARLYLAQVTEISRSRNVNAARKSFRKLLKDRKNKDFKDKIYYEMGMFELKQKNIRQAIDEFNLSVRVGTNKRIDGESYLRLGSIYYDTLKNYEKSQAYYDSAIRALPADYEGYAKIKVRSEILNEFVKHLKTIEWQDSLLSLSNIDSVSLRARIDSVFAEKKRLADKAQSKKKKRANRIEIGSNDGNVFIAGDESGLISEDATWYFSNPSAMGVGQTEFKRLWGEIPLEDNWRRSLKGSGSGAERPTDLVTTNPGDTPTTETGEPQPEADPAAEEYARIDKEIPRTDEQKKVALKKIEDAYFALGDIYYFKLEEPKNAIDAYTTLLRRFPETEYEPEVLYKLYLFNKERDPALAEQYANVLKEKHPNSTFAKILINPDYLKESSETAEKQKVLYKKAYAAYQEAKYFDALQTVDQARAMGQTFFSQNLDLLKILITGETENVNQYQFQLDAFIKTYPDGTLTPYAKNLLNASRDFQLNQEKNKGITYIRSLEEPHYFVIVHKKTEKLSETATGVMEKFNAQYFKDLKLKTGNLTLNDDYAITLVSEIPGISYAMEYRKTFADKLSTLTELRNFKFNTFVITKDNFDIFYRTKGLDEYLQFFEKNYPAENQ